MLDALAFLPVADVRDGMRALKEVAPEGLSGLADYFDVNYVSGTYRTVTMNDGSLRLRRTEPRFNPETWNVHEATMTDQQRTNNMCESWNNGFKHLVGHSNPSIWTVIDCLAKDAAVVETDIYNYQRGQPAPKRGRKATIVHQKRLKTLCQQYVQNEKSLAQFLYAMGQCIRLN